MFLFDITKLDLGFKSSATEEPEDDFGVITDPLLKQRLKERQQNATLSPRSQQAAKNAGVVFKPVEKQVVVPPAQIQKKTIDMPRLKKTLAYNETKGIPEEKEKYSSSQDSGRVDLGDALGKYRVTEGELETFSKKYLGKKVGKSEFLGNPQLQETYMDNKLADWESKGFTIEDMLLYHRGGLGAKKEEYPGYISEGLAYYESLTPAEQAKEKLLTPLSELNQKKLEPMKKEPSIIDKVAGFNAFNWVEKRSQLIEPESKLDNIFKASDALREAIETKTKKPIDNFITSTQREFAMPAIEGFLGEDLYKKLVKGELPETIKEPETKIAPVAGKIVGWMTAFGLIQKAFSGLMKLSSLGRTLITTAPKIAQGIQIAESGLTIDQLQAPVQSTLNERRNIFIAGVPAWIGWGVAGGTEAKKVYAWLPTIFSTQFMSSKIEGKENLDAFKEALTMSAIFSVFKVGEFFGDPVDGLKKQAAEKLKIKANATLDEAKDAYRRLAHQYHPDKPGGDKVMFEEINNAYQTFTKSPTQLKRDIFNEIADFYKYLRSPEGRGVALQVISNMPVGLSIKDVSGERKEVKEPSPEAKKAPQEAISAEKGIIQAKASGQSFDKWVKGQPTYYHGTSGDFETFKPFNKVPAEFKDSSGQHTFGTYFTDNKDLAGQFGKNILERKLNVSKPFDVSGIGSFDELVKKLGLNTEKNAWELRNMKSASYFDKLGGESESSYRALEALNKKFDIVKQLKKQGYDGLIFADKENGIIGKTTVVFDTSKIKTRSQLKAEWDKAGIIPKELEQEARKAFEFQDTNQEKIIHSAWKTGNSYRFELEGSGDIFRELTKKEPDFGYISEKINRTDRLLTDIEKGTLHIDDSLTTAKNAHPEKITQLKELWGKQPVTNNIQQTAKDLNIALLDGDYKKARTLLEQIKAQATKGAEIKPTEAISGEKGIIPKELEQEKMSIPENARIVPARQGKKETEFNAPDTFNIQWTTKDGTIRTITNFNSKEAAQKYIDQAQATKEKVASEKGMNEVEGPAQKTITGEDVALTPKAEQRGLPLLPAKEALLKPYKKAVSSEKMKADETEKLIQKQKGQKSISPEEIKTEGFSHEDILRITKETENKLKKGEISEEEVVRVPEGTFEAWDTELEKSLVKEINAEITSEMTPTEIDDIVSGQLKMRPPKGIKTDWIETIGRGNYMRIFGGGRFAKYPDEVANDMGISENELMELVADKMSKPRGSSVLKRKTPVAQRPASQPKTKKVDIYHKLQNDVEVLGGLESPTIIQSLNEVGGYNFQSIDELKNALDVAEKNIPVKKTAKVKLTPEQKTDRKLIMEVERRQKVLLSQSQRETLNRLHDISKPSEATMFYKSEEIQSWIRKIKQLQNEKRLSKMTISRIKREFDIGNLKFAKQENLQELKEFLDKLQPGDTFLSEKQLISLQELLKEVEKPQMITKRVLIDMFGERTDLLPSGVVGKVLNELIPTVDIKEGHPLIKRIVDNADQLLETARENTLKRDTNIDKMLNEAEKARKVKLSTKERISRALAPQNKEIFSAMGGIRTELFPKEVAVVAYLKNFFNMVREDLKLENYRKHYITHLEQELTEKIITQGLAKTVGDIFKLRKKETIPINIMLELDNIIGSEKFFKFAMERRGGIDPTTNIRKIIHEYSQLYETKKALDKILPEGQAITKLLLQRKSALWMKNFLQNVKGRGLDESFRRGKMSWLAKTADGIVDIGYLKLLGLNYWSALKNLVAGEANSFIYQDLKKFLIGKKRLFEHPRKTIRIAQKYGALEGTYADYAQKGIGKLKKVQQVLMVGQKAGEFEIRSSLFAGELTEQEWNTEEVSPERIRELKDFIAITQGIFSKTDSPLWLQTWYGRLVMQMNRWRITNVMLMRRLELNAIKEIKAGKKYGKWQQKISKAFIIYGIGMYLAYKLGEAGYKKASQVAQSMGEVINSIVQTITLKPIVDALSNNPTYSALKEIAYSIQELAAYIGVPGAQEPSPLQFQQGLEKTWIAPIERTKELLSPEKEGPTIPKTLNLKEFKFDTSKFKLKPFELKK